MVRDDTIAAIATAMAPSGIGIVRMSGPEAVNISEKVFAGLGKKKLRDASSHTIHYGMIMDGDELIDEVLLLLMRSPHSYTMEDTVEIDCHGGPQVMQRILKVLVKNGARTAEPGEFTKRAFLNGRIDLSSAEAVSDLIYAKNDLAQENAISQVRGSIYRTICGLRTQILDQTAFIEAALDDPEHYSLDGYPQVLSEVTRSLLSQIGRLIHSFQNGSLLKEGIRAVIVGRPNAGKSSWMNLLTGQERSIVTEIAGTTRDTIEDEIRLGQLTLRIMDTAGIRRTGDRIEQIGVKRAKEKMLQADLILYVADASSALDADDEEILSALPDKPVIVLLNKTDLEVVQTKELMEETLKAFGHSMKNCRILSVSAAEERGLTQIEEAVSELFFGGEVSFNSEVYITNTRQLFALQDAQISLNLVQEGLEDGMPEDCLSVDLMDAYEALGKVIGESVGEDLINEIFDRFCMGK